MYSRDTALIAMPPSDYNLNSRIEKSHLLGLVVSLPISVLNVGLYSIVNHEKL
jgi:hypothetical protein